MQFASRLYLYFTGLENCWANFKLFKTSVLCTNHAKLITVWWRDIGHKKIYTIKSSTFSNVADISTFLSHKRFKIGKDENGRLISFEPIANPELPGLLCKNKNKPNNNKKHKDNLNLASKSCEGSQLVKVRGFHGTRTHGFGVSAEVLYRLSYEDPYVGSRPI